MATLTLEQRHHLHGAAWMVFGSLAVFLLLLYINESAPMQKEEKLSATTEFEVKQPTKPKPKKQVKKRVPKRQNTPPPPLPPIDLSMDLAGLDLGLGGFFGDIGGVDESLLGDTKNVIMTSDMVDAAPRVMARAALEYPARAKNKEIDGYVVLSLLINEQGDVEKVKVIEASPSDVFEDAAERSIKGWKFEPARYKGKVVKAWANQTIRFELG